MRKTDTKIKRYIEGDYLIDIVDDGYDLEAWLTMDEVGIQVFMFGIEKGAVTKKELMQIVKTAVPAYSKWLHEIIGRVGEEE